MPVWFELGLIGVIIYMIARVGDGQKIPPDGAGRARLGMGCLLLICGGPVTLMAMVIYSLIVLTRGDR